MVIPIDNPVLAAEIPLIKPKGMTPNIKGVTAFTPLNKLSLLIIITVLLFHLF
jgi:hypothetical protein